MNLHFEDKRITGLLTITPRHEQSFIEDMKDFNFPEARSRKLMQVMGYDKHRLVGSQDTCVSDLVVYGLTYLFQHKMLEPDSFDALILVTQTPDYQMPPTSNVIQGRLQLKQDIVCLDINQGCAGYIIGLMQAFLLLEQKNISKVLVVNADILSRSTSVKDRNSYPLIGDAASITVVERDFATSSIYTNIKMDGTRHDALIIPAGGMKLPRSSETAILREDAEGNLRAQDHLRMDGSAVFNFVQNEVPPMISALMEYSRVSPDKVDWYLFHQPNRFMLQKLADKMNIPHTKMPMNVVEQYGNSSGVTIPMVITSNLKSLLLENQFLVCLAGFGVGLTWGSMLMQLGNMQFCEMIDY